MAKKNKKKVQVQDRYMVFGICVVYDFFTPPQLLLCSVHACDVCIQTDEIPNITAHESILHQIRMFVEKYDIILWYKALLFGHTSFSLRIKIQISC